MSENVAKATIWRAMSEEERAAIAALRGVRFPVASPPKSLARHLAAQAATSGLITDKQAGFMWRTVHRFRRQIPREIVDLGSRISDRRSEIQNPKSEIE